MGDLSLSPAQLFCILPKKESITTGPNGRRFLERLTEHVKSAHQCTDPDFIESKNCHQNKKSQCFHEF